MKLTTKLLAATAIVSASSAGAAELEIMHWWTSGGEAAAVSKFADALNERTDHTWVDGAIAGGGDTARPVMVSRIIGGDPPAAFQFNHGRQAEELIEAGLMLDLTDVAEAEGWKDIVNPPSLLDACTVDGRIYCAPVNIHSWQWMWLSNAAFEKAGVDVPSSYTEFVAAAPALREAGIVPLAMGGQSWQQSGAFGVMNVALAGQDLWLKINRDKDADAVRSPEFRAVLEAFGDARALAEGLDVQDWNLATAAVIEGTAGAQIMGDWAQGEFAVAGSVEGEDYTCLAGLGESAVLSTGGDAFYFPVNSDDDITAAQKELAALLLSPEVQVSFNSAKGSLPVRGDVDLTTVNGCTEVGLQLLADNKVLPDGNQLLAPDAQTQINDLMTEFWNDPDMSIDDVQERYAQIIETAG